MQHSSRIRLGSPPPVFNGHTRPVILNQSQANVLTYLFKTPTCVHMLLLHMRKQQKKKSNCPSAEWKMGKTVWNFMDFTALRFEHTAAFGGHVTQMAKVWGLEICFYANFNCTEHNEFQSAHRGQQDTSGSLRFRCCQWNASICV